MCMAWAGNSSYPMHDGVGMENVVLQGQGNRVIENLSLTFKTHKRVLFVVQLLYTPTELWKEGGKMKELTIPQKLLTHAEIIVLKKCQVRRFIDRDHA